MTQLLRVFILSFLFIAGVSSAALAQGTVQGTVTDAEGEPLPGVNVVIPELDLGAATGVDGSYVIADVPTGEHTVEARFVGFQPAQEQVTVEDGETSVVDFALRESTMEMDEIIVTGTGGNARRREIGNSIGQIDASKIEATPTANFGDLLQGRTAGATIMNNSGQVGAGSTIRLRGINSATQGNSPLIYIDGVRVSGSSMAGDPETNQATSPLDDLNPDDIQRIEIIKGPAATTLYGTEASAGVIQVFTKEGAAGAPRFDLTIRQGINNMGTAGHKDYHKELSLNNCEGEPGCPEGGDWFRNGHVQNYNLSVRGGNENVNYFVSGKWGREEGVIDPQNTENYRIRGNVGFAPFENLQIRFNNSYSHRKTRWIPDGNNAEGLLLNVLRGDQGYTPDNNDALALEMDLFTTSNHFTSGLRFDWTPTDNMLHQLSLGIDYVESEYTEERPFGFFYDPLGDRENQTEHQRDLTLDYNGSFSANLSSSITSSSSWGGQLYSQSSYNLNGFGYEFAGPGRKVIDNAARTEAFESRINVVSGGFFGQQRFGLNDMLFLTLGLRVDGHSTFGEDFGLAPYPKVSMSYLISEHGFWPEWWETLKLRSAFGESGKAPGVFDALRTYDSVSGDEGEPGLTPSNLGNPDLGPERSREVELGFDASALDGRLTGSFTWYDQRTYEALIDVQPTPSEGFTNAQLRNVGELKNKGIEAELDVAVVRSEGFQWNVGGHFSTNFSEAVDLGDISSISVGWRQYIRPGYPVPSAFQDVVVNPNEVPEDPSSLEFEEQYLGPSYPTHTFGINTSFTLQRLTVDVLGEGQSGHVIYAGTAYQNTRRSVWPQCSGIQERLESGDTAGLTAGEIGLCDPNQTTYGMWAQPADFFKLRSVSASYQLPDSWMPERVNGITLRFQARNLLTFTDFPGLDPEAFEDGSQDTLYRQEYYNLPPSRSFALVLNAQF